MERQARPPENAGKKQGERVDHLAELGEDQDLFLAGRDHLGAPVGEIEPRISGLLPKHIGASNASLSK
jgi:hypothetical protein